MATGVGSVGPPLAAACTSDQECQWPFALMVAAIPAGAAASTSPAATAAMFRRSNPTGSHARLRRIRVRPVSINLSRSKVPPQRMVSAMHAVMGSSSEAGANGERKTNRASGKSATAAETGESKNDQAPPGAPSRGNSMKPSILPIAAQYEVAAATKAKTGSRSQGAVSPNRLRSAQRADDQEQHERVEVHHPAEVAAAPPPAHIKRKGMAQQSALAPKGTEHPRSSDTFTSPPCGEVGVQRRVGRSIRRSHRIEVDRLERGLLFRELVK